MMKQIQACPKERGVSKTMLQEAISTVDYEFEIEEIIAKQVGAVPLPFPGMDSTFDIM